MRKDAMEGVIFASFQARKLAAAIETFPNLKQVLVLRLQAEKVRETRAPYLYWRGCVTV